MFGFITSQTSREVLKTAADIELDKWQIANAKKQFYKQDAPSGGGNESESDSQSQTYSALDTNQDGTVSLEELLSGAQEKSADSSGTSSSTSSEDKFSKLKTAMLESILSYYSSNSSSSSNSTSALNLSA